MKHSYDLVILEGLEVTIEYTVQSAEPDVGIMSDYPEEWFISHIGNRKCPDDLDAALRAFLSPKEEDAIIEALPTDFDDGDY